MTLSMGTALSKKLKESIRSTKNTPTMRTFKSRIDGTPFYSLLVVTTAGMLYCLWVGYVVAWVLCMLGAVFLIARITGTEYRFLDDGTLVVRSGYLASRHVAVTEITRVATVVKGHAFFAPYALSRHGIALSLEGEKRPLFVSPKELDAFVRELLRRNPAIEISDLK